MPTELLAKLQLLGYQKSKNFVRADSPQIETALDHVHLFRKARDECGLLGVYVLRPNTNSLRAITPVVYVCEAENEQTARSIHRRVWNQNVVPFVLVLTPRFARLYTGFRYQEDGDEAARGILKTVTAYNEIADELAGLAADAIDKGRIWKEWGKHVTPEGRVDVRLLDSLRELDALLQNLPDAPLDPGTAHALIGKYVYLSYLRHRNILSDRKFRKWGIKPEAVFSRDAKLCAFWTVDERLDDELNGAIFPLTARKRDIRAKHVKEVAGAFRGDSPQTGQLYLSFEAYDFSFLPSETLSRVYEQFLHQSDGTSRTSRGKKAAAYYTPTPLVNYVIEELDRKHPLREGMRVLDPACGSGAFLVQCYRRLIEQTKRSERTEKLTLTKLRSLLTDHVFGVEKEPDACQVAELNLALTLLDNCEPPDLENTTFKLPELHNVNIFESDYFDSHSAFAERQTPIRFDWVVGNPPWKEFSSGRVPKEDRVAFAWMQKNAERFPTGGHQLAEAFVWKVTQDLDENGVIGLVVPAMTLFKYESEGFRRAFFSRLSPWCVANFANLAYVLFEGRAKRPAAVLFYGGEDSPAPQRVLTFAPFVAGQRPSRPESSRRKRASWGMTVDATGQREIARVDATNGDGLFWKACMWGSYRDVRLLRRIERVFPSLDAFCAKHDLIAPREGPQLRPAEAKDDIEFVPELVGKLSVDFSHLKSCGCILRFPDGSLSTVPKEMANVRVRGGKGGLAVCRPPHIVVDASRRFAVFSSRYLVVPPRQIGIAGTRKQVRILKALSLYLTSDVVPYHQFFRSPEWGVSTTRATLRALGTLPVPLAELGERELQEWADARDHLAEADRKGDRAALSEGLRWVDEQVSDLLELRPSERVLVRDFLGVKMELVQGKAPRDLLLPPRVDTEMLPYLTALKDELNGFIGTKEGLAHSVSAFRSNEYAAVVIDLLESNKQIAPEVADATEMARGEFARLHDTLLRQHSQWLYFQRRLLARDRRRIYLFKPMEQLQWTQTQALLDADDVIADILARNETE